ncbi:OmpA family protein [candidate division GN15 bacterium]|nr:OmpA family protein [candidate division GN15 bacterium]
MPRRRKKFNDNENLERWLLTYADLITLLLAFFIVMYSMSKVDNKKFGKVSDALNTVLRGGHSVLRFNVDPERSGHGFLKLGNLRMVQHKIEEKFKTLGRNEDVQREITERGLVIHIVESALFSEGSATLQPRAMEVLDLIADQLTGRPNHIRIEGHTDDRPIQTPIYPSNWELSSARATTVVRYYVENHDIPPDRVSALGYGEFRPVKANTTPENRSRNRRVDIVILTMEVTLTEPTSQLYYSNEEPGGEEPAPPSAAAPTVE